MSDKPQTPPEKFQLRPHRCNDRIEDAIFALFEGTPRGDFFPLVRLAGRCFASEPGQEPTDEFRFIQPQTGPVFTTLAPRGVRGRVEERKQAEVKQAAPVPVPVEPPPSRSSWWRRSETRQAP